MIKIILLFLFSSTILIFFSRKSTVFEVEKIAKDLICIRKISDFSSNKNHPVDQVENIGLNLYSILRKVQELRLVILKLSKLKQINLLKGKWIM